MIYEGSLTKPHISMQKIKVQIPENAKAENNKYQNIVKGQIHDSVLKPSNLIR